MSQPDPSVLWEDYTLLTRPEPALEASAGADMLRVYYDSVLIGAAVLLAIVWVVLRWRARARRMPSAERAHFIALRELAQWRGLDDETRLREGVAEISAILRRYVEARFAMSAPTMTTEQFIAAQRHGNHIPSRHMPFWETFLDAGDAIKYAGNWPAPAQFEALLLAAEAFVKDSREGAP